MECQLHVPQQLRGHPSWHPLAVWTWLWAVWRSLPEVQRCNVRHLQPGRRLPQVPAGHGARGRQVQAGRCLHVEEVVLRSAIDIRLISCLPWRFHPAGCCSALAPALLLGSKACPRPLGCRRMHVGGSKVLPGLEACLALGLEARLALPHCSNSPAVL